MMTPFRLDGRAALVTGGASGIGEATCRALTGAGASGIVADIDQAPAKALASQLARADALLLDICDQSAVQAALAGNRPLRPPTTKPGLRLGRRRAEDD